MDNIIVLKKNGFFINEYDEEDEKWEETEITESISYYLQHCIEIDKDITFGDFINHLSRHEELIDIIFMGYTKGFKLRPFINEMNKPTDKKTELNYIEVCWETDIFRYNKKDLKDISEYVVANGIKILKKGVERYSLGFIPLNELKDIPLRINNVIEYVEHDIPELWEDKKIKTKKIFKGRSEMSLYELVGGVLYEITFYGYPQNRDEKRNELDEWMETIDKEEIVPFDEFRIEILERELKDAIRDENYEIAEKIKNKINELKK